MNPSTPQDTQPARPGGLLSQVAASLAARSLPIRCTHDQDEGLLRITGLASRYCTVIAEDSGHVLADCWPAGPPPPRASALAATAMRVLDDREDWQPGDPVNDPDLTLLSRAGLALRAAGLTVRLNILADQANLEACTQIVVTRPGRPGRGEVRIGDDGTFTWECQQPHTAGETAERIASILTGIAGSAPGPGSR
ncbi:MAG TPA: hypothetical protein VH637_15825 [Streptosporangiaceae bacterium]